MLALHHIDLVGGRGEHVGHNPQLLSAAGVQNLQAEQIGDEVPPLGQHHAGTVDGDGLALEGHGGVHVGDALQRGEDIALVYPSGAHLYGRSVQIEGIELEQKLGAVAPGDDFDLPLNAVGVDNLSGLQKLIFHLKYLPQAARPGGRALH